MNSSSYRYCNLCTALCPPPHTHIRTPTVNVCVVWCGVVWCEAVNQQLYTHARRVVVSLVTSMAKCTEVWITPSTSFHNYVPLRDQVSSLLTRQLVEEAVLLAETIAAVEAAKERIRQKRYYSESWSIVVIL